MYCFLLTAVAAWEVYEEEETYFGREPEVEEVVVRALWDEGSIEPIRERKWRDCSECVY